MGYQEHQARAATEGIQAIRCGIVTISDTRDATTDSSGAAIRAGLEAAGHRIVEALIVKDDAAAIVAAVQGLEQQGCQLIVTNGGTGIAHRDTTFEAVSGLIERSLPGFGELFRMLSFEQIGPAAMLSRATAGLYGRALIFVLPGSTGAVRLAMERLILPELHHLVWEVLRQAPPAADFA